MHNTQTALTQTHHAHNHTHAQPLIPLPSFSSTGKLTDMIKDPQNALRLLRTRLQTQKLHLTDQARHMLPKGHKSQKTKMSVNRLSDLIHNDQIIISDSQK